MLFDKGHQAADDQQGHHEGYPGGDRQQDPFFGGEAYIIHRTSLGCYERTLAYLIERFAGAFPLWLAPDQVVVLPVTDRAHEYAKNVEAQLKSAGIRAEGDYRSEKLGYKIR